LVVNSDAQLNSLFVFNTTDALTLDTDKVLNDYTAINNDYDIVSTSDVDIELVNSDIDITKMRR